MLNFKTKILDDLQLPEWRESFRQRDICLVVTNGCFDILHLGHVAYLEKARNLGGALLVGMNSDSSVRELKGAGRPVNLENDRAGVLAALESVSGVYIFRELRATYFLELVKPDIYVKGADYNIDTIPQEERRVVEAAGGVVKFIDFVGGRSTSNLLKKLGG